MHFAAGSGDGGDAGQGGQRFLVGEIRGISYGEWRPTLVILDDAEDEATVYSADQRESSSTGTTKPSRTSATSTPPSRYRHPPSPRLPPGQPLAPPRLPSLRFSLHPRIRQPASDLWEQWRHLHQPAGRRPRPNAHYSSIKVMKPQMLRARGSLARARRLLRTPRPTHQQRPPRLLQRKTKRTQPRRRSLLRPHPRHQIPPHRRTDHGARLPLGVPIRRIGASFVVPIQAGKTPANRSKRKSATSSS